MFGVKGKNGSVIAPFSERFTLSTSSCLLLYGHILMNNSNTALRAIAIAIDAR